MDKDWKYYKNLIKRLERERERQRFLSIINSDEPRYILPLKEHEHLFDK